MQTPALDPRIAKFLMERYPATNAQGLGNMWVCACSWVEDHAPKLAQSAPAFGVASLFRLQAMCVSDPQRKAGFMFSAHEALAPYQQ